MSIRRMFNLMFLFIAGLVFSFEALSNSHCIFNKKYPPKHDTVNFNGTFYIGNDIPLGSIIYQVDIKNSEPIAIECSDGFSGISEMIGLENEGRGKPNFMEVAGVGGGYVYPTNVKGVGVMYWVSTLGKNTSVKMSSPVKNGADFSKGENILRHNQTIHLSLIKTGMLHAGSEVLAGSLPTPYAFAKDAPGYSGLPLKLWSVSLTGSIKLISETCTVKDVFVDLGTYDVGEFFSGVNSVTPWIKSFIELEECPVFSGYHEYLYPQSIIGSGTPINNKKNKNMITVSLKPMSPFLDEEKAIFSLVDGNEKKHSATGLGIQLGYKSEINNTTAPDRIWQSGESWSLPLPNNGARNISIPLHARLVQTDSRVLPGTTKGRVIFTIEYN